MKKARFKVELKRVIFIWFLGVVEFRPFGKKTDDGFRKSELTVSKYAYPVSKHIIFSRFLD